MLAGAAIGKALRRRPWLALSAAFGSHFLLDMAPHIDSHGLFGIAGGGLTRAEVAMGTLDTLLGIALVLWAVGKQPGRRVMISAAFAAVVIDLLDHVPPFGAWFGRWCGTSWLSAFHHKCQHNVAPANWPVGFGLQIAVLGFALWWVRKGNPKPLD
jgi:hypothetical protein